MATMRIRHLMVLVVYVAVALGWMLPSIRWPGPDRGVLIYTSILLAPAMLAALSVFILLPGPHRDWLTCFFCTLQIAFGVLLLSAPGLFVFGTWLYWNQRPRGLERPDLGFLSLFLILGLMNWVTVFRFARYLVLRRCPHCQRTSLVASALQSRPRGGRYYRCGVCDHDARISGDQLSRRCPNCGKHTLIVKRYSFHWCLKCPARVKRLPRRPWEDAPTPSDDGFYWLWTPAASLRSVRGRVTGGSRAESAERSSSARG